MEAPEPSRAGGAGGEEEEPERAGGRPGGGGGGMAEPSGAQTRPPIRVTVKTPKDKEEIVICDRASVKEVLQTSRGARRRGPRGEGVVWDGRAHRRAWERRAGARPALGGARREERRVGGVLRG